MWQSFSLTSMGIMALQPLTAWRGNLFRVFREIAESPAIGHRRVDLTSKNILFHYAEPYVIVFRRVKARIQILRVGHKSRDIKRLI